MQEKCGNFPLRSHGGRFTPRLQFVSNTIISHLNNWGFMSVFNCNPKLSWQLSIATLYLSVSNLKLSWQLSIATLYFSVSNLKLSWQLSIATLYFSVSNLKLSWQLTIATFYFSVSNLKLSWQLSIATLLTVYTENISKMLINLTVFLHTVRSKNKKAFCLLLHSSTGELLLYIQLQTDVGLL